MITGITIENFKGIREPVHLDLRPITLLFGANSAGKSTILHALHYAREVFERHNLDADQTVAGGRFVDLGGFRGLVNEHDPSRPVVIRIDIQVDDGLPSYGADFDVMSEYMGFRFDSLTESVTSAAVELTIAWSFLENCVYVSCLKVVLNDDLFAEITAEPNLREIVLSTLITDHACLSTLTEDPGIGDSEFELVTGHSCLLAALTFCRDVFSRSYPNEWLIQIRGRGDALPTLDQPLDFNYELVDPIVNSASAHLERALTDLILGPCRLIRDDLRESRYLGPLRETPRREFLPPRFPDPSRWSSGLGAWDALQCGDKELVDAVNTWLSDDAYLSAGCSLERRSFLELDAADPVVRKLINRQAFDDVDEDEQIDFSQVPMKSRIVIIPKNSDVELRPHDVGIGISQVVPVIVTALDGEHRLLAIEQPELHIHPRLQAAIGDLFIESIHKQKHWFIIETHSEHLILRLLRRIRETEKGTAPIDRQLRTDELGIYYLKQENGSTTASRIDIDVKGEFIQPWPDDFFEIDFYERFACC